MTIREKGGNMIMAVTIENLKSLLIEAKHQFIGILLCNRAGEWSDESYEIDIVKEIRNGSQKTTLLVVHSAKNSACLVVDVNLISGIKFNKYLHHDGSLVDEIRIHRKNKVSADAAELVTN
jgi:hypothetical protein